MFKFTTIKLLRAAVIAAVYSTVTIFLAPLSYGPVQIRFAEALTILPLLFPEAVIGVTIGCLISNIFNGMWTDMVFGTLATFAAAVLTYYIGKLFKLNNSAKQKKDETAIISNDMTVVKERKGGAFLGALPPVLINAIVVPIIIFSFIQEDMAKINIFTANSFLLYILGFVSILIGQAIAVYGIGIPFYFGIKKGMNIYSAQSLKRKPEKSGNDE